MLPTGRAVEAGYGKLDYVSGLGDVRIFNEESRDMISVTVTREL